MEEVIHFQKKKRTKQSTTAVWNYKARFILLGQGFDQQLLTYVI